MKLIITYIDINITNKWENISYLKAIVSSNYVSVCNF
jgi:hypothetical protein